MWQRFTERARRAVFFAQEEAGRLGETYVSTEHLLLGLIRENDSVAARILDRMGISLSRIRSEIERQVTRGEGRLGQDMQLTPRAKRVIDLAYDEARQLLNNYIGTEHLLLGLMIGADSGAVRVIEGFGADPECVCQDVLRAISGEPEPPGTPLLRVSDAELPPSTRWYGALMQSLAHASGMWPEATLAVRVTLPGGELCFVSAARCVGDDHLELTCADSKEPGRRLILVRSDAITSIEILDHGPEWIGAAAYARSQRPGPTGT